MNQLEKYIKMMEVVLEKFINDKLISKLQKKYMRNMMYLLKK